VVAAVAGSIIMVVGQLFGAFFPIYFGPNLSDYDLVCDPVYHQILLEDSNSSYGVIFSTGGGKKLVMVLRALQCGIPH
jgi:hypothetical protein